MERGRGRGLKKGSLWERVGGEVKRPASKGMKNGTDGTVRVVEGTGYNGTDWGLRVGGRREWSGWRGEGGNGEVGGLCGGKEGNSSEL